MLALFSGPNLPITILVAYCVAVVVASLAGGGITQRLRITHTGMQHIISLVGGVMLGTAVFHLLPHALHDVGRTVSVDNVMLAMMLGIVMMFAMLRLFHHHHHGEQTAFQPTCDHEDHDHDHTEHSHDHGHSHTPAGDKAGPASGGHAKKSGIGGNAKWLGVLLGLTIHTLIDGVTLAAAVMMDASHPGRSSLLLGFGAFLAVFLHKPLDAISITSLMAANGKSESSRRIANFAFALACPLGAALCYAGLSLTAGPAVAYLLAFSAGVFLCIALSDLLPEMEFHSHDRFSLTSMLLLGLIAAWLLRFLEGDLHG